jgi:ElaB/YqjD/DUF883 family membrane-anchored ribosome-binding protein
MMHKDDILTEAQKRMAILRDEAKARAEALLEEAKDRGNEILKAAQGQGERAVKDSKLWVMENPAQAVGLAFLAGVITSTVIASSWFLGRRED